MDAPIRSLRGYIYLVSSYSSLEQCSRARFYFLTPEVGRLGLSTRDRGARGRAGGAHRDGALLGTDGDDLPEHCIR